MRISIAGTPVPNRDVELKASGSGPVTTYTLSPEEMDKQLKALNITNDEDKNEKEEDDVSNKYPHITKELLEAEFAKGKTGLQIQKEQGLPAGTIGYYMKKFGVVNPNSTKKKKPKNKLKSEKIKTDVGELKEKLNSAIGQRNVLQAENAELNKQILELTDEKNALLSTVDRAVTEHETDHDPVNHPSHYTAGQVECIDAIESATTGLTGGQAYATGAAIKYLWRWSRKNGIEDLNKAKWYIDRLITLVEQESNEITNLEGTG